MHFLHPGRNLDDDRPVVIERAAPFEQLAVARKLQSCQVNHWPAGRVFAGNPLRVVKSQGTGSRRNRKLRVQDFSRSVGCVESNGDVRRGGRSKQGDGHH